MKKKKFPVYATTGVEALKYQPNEPLLVEFAPAYQVLDKEYARTLEMDR